MCEQDTFLDTIGMLSVARAADVRLDFVAPRAPGAAHALSESGGDRLAAPSAVHVLSKSSGD